MSILTNAQPEVTATNTVTLTNKTLTSPTISDPTITGTTTNINSTNLVVEDKNIVINDVTSPSDSNADGGGISLNGDTTKSLNWVNATDAWTSSEHIDLASGKEFKINNTTVLSSSAVLGKTVPSGDIVGSSDTQTLSNKTLTTPVLGVATATSINGTSIPSSKTLLATDSTVSGGTLSTATSGVGYLGLPQNSTTTGAYTIAASDAGKHIYSTATRTITIDSNANLALPVGTTVVFVANSGVTVTIAITTDTMYLAGPGTTGSRTLAPFGMATAVKITSTSWMISGNGLT